MSAYTDRHAARDYLRDLAVEIRWCRRRRENDRATLDLFRTVWRDRQRPRGRVRQIVRGEVTA